MIAFEEAKSSKMEELQAELDYHRNLQQFFLDGLAAQGRGELLQTLMNNQEAKLSRTPLELSKEDMEEVEKVMSGYIGDTTKAAYSNMQARFIIFLYSTNESTKDLLHESVVESLDHAREQHKREKGKSKRGPH